MKKILIPVLLISVLFLYGCSSSSSGGNDAPSGDYSGVYTIARDSGDPDYWTFSGELTIVQNGSNVALHYADYSWKVEEVIDEDELEIDYNIELVYYLRGTGVGKVRGRDIDVTWQGGSFTRLTFSETGDSFSAVGDLSFAGVIKH